MANRRLAAFAEQYLRYMLQSRLQEQNAEAVYSRQEANAKAQDDRQIRQAAIGDDTGRVAHLTGQTQFQPSGRALLRGLSKSIGDSKQLGDLPTDADVRTQAGGILELGGHRKDGATPSFTGLHVPMARQQSAPTDGTLPSSSLVPTERPDIAELIAQRATKKDAILNNYRFEDDRELAMVEGEAESQARGVNDAANTHLPDVLKRNSGIAANALESEINKRRALDPMDIRRAAGMSGAAENAQIGARARRLDDLTAIADAMKGSAGTTTTEGERRAAGYMPTLANAHQKLTEMATNGSGLRGGVQMVMGNPALANTVGRMFTDEEKAFNQAAGEWTNTASLIMSGVQVRQDERQNFMSAMVENMNDPPQIKTAKQNARRAFLSAAQISAGRAGMVAGEALADAVKNGTLDSKIIGMLDMNDEVKAGFVERLGQ